MLQWTNAHVPDPSCGLQPTSSGWALKDGTMEIVWFEDQQMPSSLEMNASQINEVPTDEEDDDRQNQYDSESDDSEYEEDLFN